MGRRLTGPGLALLFLALCAAVAAAEVLSQEVSHVLVIAAASATAGYMALNIGANDVANNVGPAVGARVISLTGALLLAAVCETAGAFLAGREVVSTVSQDIFSSANIGDNLIFMQGMLTAMVASALWINFATFVGAPVSTTHSVIGGVVGAGMALGGVSAIDWSTVSAIALTWMTAPVIAGTIAAVLMAFMNRFVYYRRDRLEAAYVWLPVLLGLTGAIFTAFLLFKSVQHQLPLPGWLGACISLLTGLLVWRLYRTVIARRLPELEDNSRGLKELFAVPLMVTAALLSFAHGANDLANAIGPLAAIVSSHAGDTDLSAWYIERVQSNVPIWVTGVGAFGISAGLLLFGRRLVTVVGKQITKLSPIRAFCVTLATAVTVLTASSLGLPVSSTHTVVGAVFGVGFFREWYLNRYVAEGNQLKPRKTLRNREVHKRRLLVRRASLLTIVAAWAVTVPITALLSAALVGALGVIFQ
ncbi:inorganic phosphate transporter [Labrenzia aggregata]|uniref:Phosphate transporter n=2 Tax=Roseibium aggregatum TaxID=187304 RepID=A0A939ECX8_9HYPH|nr:inorganic phosphate transporter [Roseibium aggregatum]